MNDFWNDFSGTHHNGYKVAASNVNIKIHRLFSRQRILGVRVTIAQRKTSENLARTGS